MPTRSGLETSATLRDLATIVLALFCVSGRVSGGEPSSLPWADKWKLPYRADEPVAPPWADIWKLAGRADGLLPNEDLTLREAMQGEVTMVAACQAVAPGRSEKFFSGGVVSTQTFRLLESFYGKEKAGATISVCYGFADPEMNTGRNEREVRANEKVIWILHHDGLGGDHGVKAIPDTAANRSAVCELVAQLPSDLKEHVEIAKAEQHLANRLFAIGPVGCSGSWSRQGKVQPTGWEAGEGMQVALHAKGSTPKGLDANSGWVIVCIMKPGYAGKSQGDAAPQTPASEIATWRGRRVFFCAERNAWPTAQADVLEALNATAATTTSPSIPR